MSQPVAVSSASLARSSPRCQPWSSLPRFPSGSSRLWSGPATKPSSEIDMWQVVSGIATLSKLIAIATPRGGLNMREHLAKQPLHACPVHKRILVGRHERRVPATAAFHAKQQSDRLSLIGPLDRSI